MTQRPVIAQYSTPRAQLDQLLSQSLMTLLLFLLLGRGLGLTAAPWAAWALAVPGGFAALAWWHQDWSKAELLRHRNSWRRNSLFLLLGAASLITAHQLCLAYPSLPVYQPGLLAATLVLNSAVYIHRLLKVMPRLPAIILSTGIAWAGLWLSRMI